jgi:hypothetical protein
VDEEEYEASFFDANIHAAGCNQAEAFESLKGILLSRFEHLSGVAPEKLGPGPAKQLEVLRAFIRGR